MTQAPEDLSFAQRTALVELEQAATAPEPSDPPTLAWPTLREEALYGLPGEVVRKTAPFTEADPNAVLLSFLAFAGCYLGGDAFVIGGNRPHPARFWPILVGTSARGAKGTAVSVVREVCDAIDPGFWAKHKVTGLSSSEGLIKRVRDSRGDDPEAKDFDEGVDDKRLFVVEEELATVLNRSRREGSSLSGTIREAYDGGTLQTLTSGNPMRATDPHIVIVGAITPTELVEKLTALDVANGFANRFGIVCSRRSKLLPDGGSTPASLLAPLAVQFRSAAQAARTRRRLDRSPAASELWREEYHRRHAALDEEEGVLATLLARWHAHTARMSVAYALLDESNTIELEHVQAALAAWDYVEASTRYTFGAEDSDPDLGRLVEYVDSAELGRTREAVSSELFQRHKTKKQLDEVLARLLALGRYKAVKVPPEGGRGRPKTFYVRIGSGSAS